MSDLALIEEQPAPGRRYDARPGTTIGRAGCDVLLADPDVSRRHAILRKLGAGIAIEDLGSRNGTFVNGRRISGLTELAHGDELRLGNTLWRVEAAAGAAESLPPAAGPADRTVISAPPPRERQPPAEKRRAGFGMRLGASVIDGLILGLIGGLLIAGLQGVGFALAWVGALAYFVLFEGGHRGRTLGKHAVGIDVTDAESGRTIGYGRATVRYLGRILSAIPLFLGYLWMLWDPHSQTWHDKLAGTVVVGVARPHPPG